MRKAVRVYLQFSLVWKIAIGFAIGIVLGIIFGPSVSVIGPLGDVFIKLLQMLVPVLVFFTILNGMLNMEVGRLGRLGGKTLLYFAATLVLACGIGLGLAMLIDPGAGLTLPQNAEIEVEEALPLQTVLLNIVPSNAIAALSEGDILAIIFFAILLGTALSVLRGSDKTNQKVKKGLEAISSMVEAVLEAIFLVIRGIMQYAPVGVLALIAVTVGDAGAGSLLSLGKLVLVVYAGCIIMLVLYALIVRLFGKPVTGFYKAMSQPMVSAFVTHSSAATLPLNMRAAERMKLPRSIYGFSLPLGSVINMDGTALYMSAAVVFAAGASGQPLTVSQMVMVVAMGLIASVGVVGVPGSALVMTVVVFNQLGMPVEAIALIAGVDALMSAARTVVNIVGDQVATVAVSASEEARERRLKGTEAAADKV